MFLIRRQLETEAAAILREKCGRVVKPGVPIHRYLDLTSDRRLKQLREALERIENGTYGTCVICGRPVPQGIIVKSPLALLCGRCRR